MAKKIVPQEDNTSEILKADLLKYGYLNNRNRNKKNLIHSNASKRQEFAIRSLQEENDKLVTDLNAALCKTKLGEDGRYRAKFANLIQETNQIDIELSEQRKIELEVDKEISDLEIELDKTNTKTKKPTRTLKTTTNKHIEYNKLLNEQNELRIQVESSLREWQQTQSEYNSYMNKLSKGKELVSELSEQVKRTFKFRNDAKERLDIYSKTSKLQIDDQEKNIELYNQQLHDNYKMSQFLRNKLQRREIKNIKKSKHENTEILALNAEAKAFIKHLIYIGEEKDLEKIMEDIVKMDLDNESKHRFLNAVQAHLTEEEITIQRSREEIIAKINELSDIQAAKTVRLDNVQLEYKDGCESLLKARRTLRSLGLEWRQICLEIDDVCDLMGMDRNRTSVRLVPCFVNDSRVSDSRINDPVSNVASIASSLFSSVSKDDNNWQSVPPPEPAQVIEYFYNVDKRLDTILHRLFWIQNNCGDKHDNESNNDGPRQQLAVGDYMSTGSEQEDDFVTHDQDDDKNRHVKLIATVDLTSLPAEIQQLEIGNVNSLCPECLGKRHEEGENRELTRLIRVPKVNAEDPSSSLGLCHNKNVSLQNIKNEEFKLYYHTTRDCPYYSTEKKRQGNN